jgi:hypothetical protein
MEPFPRSSSLGHECITAAPKGIDARSLGPDLSAPSSIGVFPRWPLCSDWGVSPQPSLLLFRPRPGDVSTGLRYGNRFRARNNPAKRERSSFADNGESNMKKPWIVTAAAIAMMSGSVAMSGSAVAQLAASSSSSTETTTSVPVMPAQDTMTRTTRQTTDSDGVVTDKSRTTSSDTSTSPYGGVTSTKKSSETTTVR